MHSKRTHNACKKPIEEMANRTPKIAESRSILSVQNTEHQLGSVHCPDPDRMAAYRKTMICMVPMNLYPGVQLYNHHFPAIAGDLNLLDIVEDRDQL
jgi:hypothetical protein